MAKKIIEISHLSKEYKLYQNKKDRLREAISFSKKQYHKTFYALKDISFDAEEGETIGIIGTNGSGKSTLLKILVGVSNSSGGSIMVNGRISALLELGAGFNPEYTGLENIKLNATMLGLSDEELQKKQKEIIEFADIGEYINQPVKNYSSGMFARLAFAVAISVEPQILIVDEALSVGDVFFQSKCFRKFAELKKRGTTILFVSHDIASIKKMCSRVLWIEQGVQQMFGNCKEVCDAYFNAQTRRMNQENLQSLSELSLERNELNERSDKVLKIPRITPSSDTMYSDKAEILSVYVRDSQGKIVNQIFSDMYYSIEIISKYNEPLDNVIVGFTFNNAKGSIILAGNTYADTKKGISVSKDEMLKTSFYFKMPKIRSGQYAIEPAIALGIQEQHVNLTWVYGALSVQYNRAGFEISDFGVEYDLENSVLNEVEYI